MVVMESDPEKKVENGNQNANEMWPAEDANQSIDEDAELAKHADEAKLVRKLDLHLIPLIMALYLFSFLDR